MFPLGIFAKLGNEDVRGISIVLRGLVLRPTGTGSEEFERGVQLEFGWSDQPKNRERFCEAMVLIMETDG